MSSIGSGNRWKADRKNGNNAPFNPHSEASEGVDFLSCQGKVPEILVTAMQVSQRPDILHDTNDTKEGYRLREKYFGVNRESLKLPFRLLKKGDLT